MQISLVCLTYLSIPAGNYEKIAGRSLAFLGLDWIFLPRPWGLRYSPIEYHAYHQASRLSGSQFLVAGGVSYKAYTRR